MGNEGFGVPKNKYSNRVRQEIEDGLHDFEDEKENEKRENQIEKEEESLDKLISTDDFLEKHGEDSASLIYEWYSNAISRRDREPIESGRFFYHFFEGGSFDDTFMFGDFEKGFILGYQKYGVFIPTHFAPKNHLRAAYNLMKQLGSSKEVPCVMSVTEDIIKTITKMPEWKKLDMSFLSVFRDEISEKQVVYNEHPNVQQLMLGLLDEYMKETQYLKDEDYEEYEEENDSDGEEDYDYDNHGGSSNSKIDPK